jgi:hypothetical protein
VGIDVGGVWCVLGIFGEIGSELLYFVFEIVGVILVLVELAAKRFLS